MTVYATMQIATATGSEVQSKLTNGTAGFPYLSGGSGAVNTWGGTMVNTSQPAFLAVLGTNDANATGAGATYILGTTGTALTEIFDQGNNFNTNGTFTAPVSGVYFFTVTFLLSSVPVATSSMQITIDTSNRNYVFQSPGNLLANGMGNATLTATTLADMDAGDTAICNVTASGGAGDTATVYGSTSVPGTMFSGYLVC